MEDLLEKIRIAEETAIKKHLCVFFSTFKIVKKMNQVSLELPDLLDKHIKDIGRRRAVTLDNPREVIEIEFHQQRGIRIDGKLVTMNYYGFSLNDFEKEKVLADVYVIKKNNYKRNGEETIILDIHKNEDPQVAALFKLEVGAKSGEFKIPETSKFVNFIPLKKTF